MGVGAALSMAIWKERPVAASMRAGEDGEKRPRGRPQARPDAETRHLIAEAALREFLTRGYSAAGMDDVAKGAGVSKRTLYRLVPTKADLFRTVVADRMDQFLLAADADALGASDLPTALERIMTEVGLLAMSRETAAIQKLVIAESERFPDLAASFHTDAVMPIHGLLSGFLRTQCDRGLLDLQDPGSAAGMLRGMMVEPLRSVMMGWAPPPSSAEVAARARACVALFLNGCLGASVRSP